MTALRRGQLLPDAAWGPPHSVHFIEADWPGGPLLCAFLHSCMSCSSSVQYLQLIFALQDLAK